jgi:hypothetical protein
MQIPKLLVLILRRSMLLLVFLAALQIMEIEVPEETLILAVMAMLATMVMPE